jgi:hypothetical protein
VRRPWSLDRALVTAALTLLVGACGGGSIPASPTGSLAAAASTSPSARATPSPSQPDPSPSPQAPSFAPSPSPPPVPPLTETFRSPTMGYTVRYPKGWTVYEATAPWQAGEDDGWDAPNGDRIESADAGFRGGSQPLAPGQSAADWIDAYVATQVTWCGTREQIQLGGSQATIDLNGCRGMGRLGGRIFDLVVVVGDRAYDFTTEGNIDRDFLDALLATIEFDPSSAVD